MKERVKLESSAASPLRISASGTAVDDAEFNTLIFDANQPPLRLWGTGWGTVAGITRDERLIGGKTVNTAVIASGFTTLSGAPAIFTCMQRGVVAPNTGRLMTPWVSLNANGNFGGGMGLCSGVVKILNTNWGNLPTGDGSEIGATAAVSYCIFKNY